MAFTTIWSVDLGKAALKAVKLRRERNSVEILAVDKVDYPLSENGADPTQQSKEALSIFKARNEVKEPVVVAHPGQGTFSRFIKLPAFDAKKVRDMVRYEASQQIPFPLDEVIWDYHIVDRDYLPGEEREVGLFAVRKEAIDDYLLEFTQAGLSVEMLTIGYLGLLNFIRYDINPPEPSIILDIGAAHTDMILVDGARFYIRPLPHSGNDISKAIMQRFKIGFADAEKLKIETGKAGQQAEKIYKAVIQPKLQELVQEIQRSLGYYRTQHGETQFAKVYLLGNGSRVARIKKFLEDTLSMPVEHVQSIGRLRVSRDVNLGLLKENLPAFGTALGMGIQAVGAGPCHVDLVPKEEKLKKEIQRKRKHVFFAAGGLLLAILGSWWLILGKIDAVNTLHEELKNDAKVKFALLPKNQKDITEAEQKTDVELGRTIDELLELADWRNGALEGLRALERVLTPATPQPPMSAVVKADDQAGRAAAGQGRIDRMGKELWVPYLRIEKVSFPEDAAAGPKSGGGKKSKEGERGEGKATVPAYKVTVYAVVKEGATQVASAETIKTRLKAPLESDLLNPAHLWRTVVKDVTTNPGTAGLKNIYYAPGGGGVGAKEEIPETQGGPFFGQELFWYMVPRHPKEPEAAPAPEPADEGDGEAKPKTRGRTSGKDKDKKKK